MERLALPRGEIARQFTKLMLSLLSHIGMERWWVATVTLRAPPFKRRLHRCNACDPKKHDAKAELNRRSQACEVLAGTGVRVAKEFENGRA